jgi:predicted DNA-binding transcriptional regulator YafY
MAASYHRVLHIDATIRSGRYPTVQEFCDEFEVAPRTIHADFAFLRDQLRAPLVYDRRHRGYAYTDRTWALPAVQLSQGELLAFFLSIDLGQQYLGTPFEKPLRQAVESQAALLPRQARIELQQLVGHATFHPGAPTRADPVLLLALFEAVQERWRVHIRYFTASRGEETERRIEPYHLYNQLGNWQLFAFDHRRQEFRSFALSRIRAWHVEQGARFSRDPGFSVEDYTAHGFQSVLTDTVEEIVVHVSPRAAPYMRERQGHPTQQIEEHADGALTLRFQTGALAAVHRWVLYYGADVEVLAPPALRAMLAATAAALTRLYADPP